ncbi:hypothetical protein [Paenibacillus lutimineralis]|nr:hypothetical protein [Paenibacillus lutimineralis]
MNNRILPSDNYSTRLPPPIQADEGPGDYGGHRRVPLCPLCNTI